MCQSDNNPTIEQKTSVSDESFVNQMQVESTNIITQVSGEIYKIGLCFVETLMNELEAYK